MALQLRYAARSDVGLVHRWGDVPLAVPDHLRVTPIGLDLADVILPADHPLAERCEARWSDLVDQSLILLTPGSGLRRLADQSLAQLTLGIKPAFEVSNVQTALGLVAAGLGISVLPRAAVEPLAMAMGLTCRALTDEWAQRRLLVAMGSGRQADDAALALIQHLTAERSPNAKARRSQ